MRYRPVIALFIAASAFIAAHGSPALAAAADETDLQVVSISRTPRYPRYLPTYRRQAVVEPSGFGPYVFGAAYGLDGGQTETTQRWPAVGDPVTYTATVRNRGTTAWTGHLGGVWRVDGHVAHQETKAVSLPARGTVTFAFTRPWDDDVHGLDFAITADDARAANNILRSDTRSVGFLTFVDTGMIEKFRADTGNHPGAATDDFFDWLNRHMTRFNELFGMAGSRKRVHFDVLQELDDNAADPAVDLSPFAVFPFRFLASEPTLRQASAYYSPADDIDYGLLHEMGHQLGLVDLYRLNIDGPFNEVTGQTYRTASDLMSDLAHVLSPNSALAMERWFDEAHGYFGQYLYALPREVRVRFRDARGAPLAGAGVTLYQKTERLGIGESITTQIKAQGTTDAGGEWTLPNVPIDRSLVPPTFAGDVLNDNPFGYVDHLGTNGLLLIKVAQGSDVDHAWLDIAEVNTAFGQGQTDVAVFERRVWFSGPAGALVTQLSGTATGIGSGPDRGGLQIVGRFTSPADVDLSAARISITALLEERAGAGELMRRLPIELSPIPGSSADLGRFENRTRPNFASADVKQVGPGQFTFRIKVGVATIASPGLCSPTQLTTSFTIHDGTSGVVVTDEQPWSCSGASNQYLKTP